MYSAVRAVSPSSISQKRLDATRQARRRSPLSSRSLKTGTNADDRAASATSARTRFGIWNATVKALIRPETPKKYDATISRTSPSTRESAVASPKIALETASRRAGGSAGAPLRRRPARHLGVGVLDRRGVVERDLVGLPRRQAPRAPALVPLPPALGALEGSLVVVHDR